AAAEVVDRIPTGERRSFAIQLVSGVANAIIAVCGQDCDHVEIALYDHQRQPLGRTPEKRDIVALNGNPPIGGLHELEVSVPGCRASACEVGFLVLRGEAGGQKAGATTYRRHENRDLWGGDIDTINGIEAENRCQSACSNNAQCRAYSFDKWR